MKKVIALALAAALTVGGIATVSCGEKEETKITNVFKETLIKLPEEYWGNDNVSLGAIKMVGDTIYSMASRYDEKTGMSESFFLPIYLDGTTGEEIKIDTPVGDENGNGDGYLNGYAFGYNGELWVNFTSYYFDEEVGYQENNELRLYEQVGDEDYTIIDLSSLNNIETGEQFYFYNMYAAPDGSLVLSSWQNAAILTADGKLQMIEYENDNDHEIGSFFVCNDKLYATIYMYGGEGSESILADVDTVNGKFGEEHTLQNSSMMYNLMQGDENYDFFYNDSNSIWAANIDEEGVTEILNFINSDIDGSNVYNILPISADKFIAMSYDNETYLQNLVVYDRIPDDQVASRELITLATPRLSYNTRSYVLKFNKSNDKYRIIVDDYSIYATDDDYNAGATRLAADLTAGKLPDILEIGDSIPFESYAARKLFADLYTLMDEDESFDKNDYLTNIFEAGEIDGKLYSLIPRFRLQTLVAKNENLEGMTGWTVEEFMRFAKEHPDMQMFDYDFNRASFIESIVNFTRSNFVNSETGECNFDSEEFKAILEFANEYLSTDDFWSNIDYDEVGDDFWMEYEERFRDNRVLLLSSGFGNLFTSARSIVNYTLYGEFTCIGFPCEEGNGAGITPSMEFSIMNKSKHKTGAWEFLKTMISEDNQMPTQTRWGSWNYGSGIPILRKAIDKQLEIAVTPPEEYNVTNGGIVYGSLTSSTIAVTEATVSAETEVVTDEAETEVDLDGDGALDSDIAVDDDIVVEPEEQYKDYLSDSQAAELLRLVTGAKQILRADDDLLAIIIEEAEYYFNGEKSLDTVVQIIQNRAETYIAESR